MARKVLVVDDDPVMHRVLKHYLEQRGYETLTAGTGGQAIEVANNELPDLILLDVGMPDMSGLAALRQLKEQAATRLIPVIVITAHADRTTQLESKISGAAAFLTKPFRLAELLDALQKILPSDNLPIAPSRA
jgi:CheY-like chemotaxis protein